MAEKHLEEEDPYEFVAVRFPSPEGVDMDAVMTRCFVEEYALMGTPRDRIMVLFRSRHFAGTNGIFQRRGESFVQAIIDDVYGPAVQEVA